MIFKHNDTPTGHKYLKLSQSQFQLINGIGFFITQRPITIKNIGIKITITPNMNHKYAIFKK